jgi:hypothetical protein
MLKSVLNLKGQGPLNIKNKQFKSHPITGYSDLQNVAKIAIKV